MTEIVVSGQKFKIAGDTPTSQEQLAIETFLGARNMADEKTGSPILDQGEFTITPEDVLTDAQKGKYNKDTEDYLAGPDFKRIVAEVGLAIAGGIAGAALAPVTGGGSLIATAGLAARVARIARPLLNINANTVRKIGYATTGAAAGGGTGAAVAQAWDPKESIVKEVARGAAQGAFGEILGFGLAGGLSKMYNKVATGSVNKLQTADAAVKVFERQKAYYQLLGQVGTGAKLTTKQLAEFKKKYPGLTTDQIKNLSDAGRAQKTITSLEQKYGGDFLDQVKAGSITPAMITENAVVDQLQSIAETSLFGAGRMRAASGGARLSLVSGIDELVENSLKAVDSEVIDPQAFGIMIQNVLKNSQQLHTRIVSQGFNKINQRIGDQVLETLQTNTGKIKVWNAQEGVTESVDNLRKFSIDRLKKLADDPFASDFSDATELLTKTMNAVPGNANFRQIQAAYERVGQSSVVSVEGSKVKAELLKRLAAYLEKAPLPTALRSQRSDLVDLFKLGNNNFNKQLFKSIASKEFGQEKIGEMILRANQKSVTDEFLDIIRAKTKAGTSLIPKAEQDKMISGIKGHFFKRFLDKTTRNDAQYTYLDAAAARKFVKDDYAPFIEKGGLINKTEARMLDEYVEALRFAEGKIFRPGTTGKGRGTIFIQLKEAGAISQLGGALALGTGTLDVGSAGVFILGPAALARLFSNPKLMKLVTEGMKGTTTGNVANYTRYMSQLGSGLVGANIITEEQNAIVQSNIEANQDTLAQMFKGEYKGMDVVPEENPGDGEPIQIRLETSTPQSEDPAVASVPLPEVGRANLPMSNNNMERMQLAQTLNLFNKGGIVSAKKVNS
jgi:hypothetical protein